jgi:hypothetical protein
MDRIKTLITKADIELLQKKGRLEFYDSDTGNTIILEFLP